MSTAAPPAPTNPARVPGDTVLGGSVPDAPFYVTGGTLPPAAPSYITRAADTALFDALSAGQFSYVLNTRQIGKSSLMIRTVRRLKETGAAVVVLDLTAVGQNLSVEQWYDGLLVMLGEQLHLEDRCEDFWAENEHLGPMQRFFAALARTVLPALGEQRLFLFVDEIDAVRSLPFSADEFFAGIRECYNRRVQDPVYNRVTFCLLGVANPADLIKDTRLSPFNIGTRITLRDFTPAEAAPLARGMGASGDLLLARALYWTGGHPYLTQRFCRAISQEGAQTVRAVDALCERLFLSKRALDSDDNLSFVQNRLLRAEFPLADVLDYYGKLRAGKRVKDDETNPLCGLLRLSGIAAADGRGDTLRLRNRIYASVFDREWVAKNMPDAELRRQWQAARTARIQVGSIAAVVIAVTAILAVEARVETKHARESEKKAQESARQTSLANGIAREKEREAQVQRHEAEVSAKIATRNAALARSNEARAKEAAKEASDQKHRADIAAEEARASAKKAQESAAVAKAAGRLAEERRQEAEGQRKEAIAQKQSAQTEGARAKQAAREADRQRQTAVEQGQLADERKRAADAATGQANLARKSAEERLDKLNEANRKLIARLNDAIAADPKDARAASDLAELYYQLAAIYDQTDKSALNKEKAAENYAHAGRAFTLYIARKPSDYGALVKRGYCYLQTEQYPEAIADFSAYIARRPQDAGNAYRNRAQAYFGARRYNEALRDIAILDRLYPVQVDYLLRGRCLMEMGLYERANDSFAQYLKQNEKAGEPFYYFYTGHSYLRQGRWDDAYAALSRYQETDPGNQMVFNERLSALMRRDRFKEAARDAEVYRKRFPVDGSVYPTLGCALLRQNDRAGYRALCRDAIFRFGGADASAENANSAAWTCALADGGLGDYAVPLRIAERAVSVVQAQVDRLTANEATLGSLWVNRNTLATLLYRAGRYEEAARELARCDAIPRTFEPADRFSDDVLWALCRARAGSPAEAREWLHKARENAPAPNAEQRLFLAEADALIGGTSK